jgi:homocysteine S-methyltransferase
LISSKQTQRRTWFGQQYFLTDGGLETTLIFHQGIKLNYFAAFELLDSESGRSALREYYRPYLDLARKHDLGFVLETPTWRASSDWGFRLGYSQAVLMALNKRAVHFLQELSMEYQSFSRPIIISGNIGPRGDGYKAENCMSADEAQAYHRDQVQAFATADADIITAMTINYSDEAIGIVQAAKFFGIPVVISFTVETDGRLPNGETLGEAIEKTDAATQGYAEHFMINCAHPQHFRSTVGGEEAWRLRIKGIRANASTKSHAELDESDTLDAGDPRQLAADYQELKQLLPNLSVLGGCCGTDHNHMAEICSAVIADVKHQYS